MMENFVLFPDYFPGFNSIAS